MEPQKVIMSVACLPVGWSTDKFIEWANKGGWDLESANGIAMIFVERQPSKGLWPFPFSPQSAGYKQS